MLNNGHIEPIHDQQTTKTKGVQIKNLLPASSQQKRTWRRLGGCKYPPQKSTFSIFLTLQLFVPKNKRLGGYTQWVQFLQNCTRCTQRKKNPEDIKQKCTSAKTRIKEDHLKISLQEGPGSRLQQLGPWRSIMKCSGACRWGTLRAPIDHTAGR